MRIYYEVGEAKYPSDDLGKAMSESVSSIHIMAMELLKYKIMWALRHLESEMNESEGIITIHSESLSGKRRISAEGFSDELIEKIQAIAKASKF